MIPEIYLTTDKIHTLTIGISFNSQNYTLTEHKILHQCKQFYFL